MAYIGRGLDKISNVEVLDNITFDGSSTSFTLQKGGVNFTPSSANNILVSIDGVVQSGNFTCSGSTIDFGVAVSASSTCNFIIHLGVGVVTTPSDGSVVTAKLADDSVTSAKLANLTSAMNFQGTASNMRLNFDTTDTVSNADPLMAITSKNKTDSVAQLSMRRESAVDDGYIALSTQATGGSLTERVRVHSGGVLSAAHGIALGVGTANTATNVLDDYEEGTFTPTWTSNVTVSVSSGNYGYYTKIGDEVTIHFGAVLTSSGGTPNYFSITNAPFQANVVSGSCVGSAREYGQTGHQHMAVISDNSTTVQVKKYDSTAVANPYLIATVTYRVD